MNRFSRLVSPVLRLYSSIAVNDNVTPGVMESTVTRRMGPGTCGGATAGGGHVDPPGVCGPSTLVGGGDCLLSGGAAGLARDDGGANVIIATSGELPAATDGGVGFATAGGGTSLMTFPVALSRVMTPEPESVEILQVWMN